MGFVNVSRSSSNERYLEIKYNNSVNQWGIYGLKQANPLKKIINDQILFVMLNLLLFLLRI